MFQANDQNIGVDDPARLVELAKKFHIELLTVIADDCLDPELVADLPVEWARAHCMLPVRHAGQPAVLVNDPAALGAQQHLNLLLRRELMPLLAARGLILAAIERCYFSRSETASEFLDDLQQEMPAVHVAPARSDDLLQSSENAPITQLINLILLEAVKAGASDVHLEPFAARLRVRFRVDGVLYEQTAPPKHLESALISRLKVMAHMDIAEKRLPQDGVARVRIGEREIDIRVSSIPVAEGERVVLRLLNRQTALRPLAGLGLAPAMLGNIEGLLRETHGIIVVCGPTGSGKTTTLYAVLQQLDKSRTNILTIEDPIEYQLADIGQMQIKPKIGLGFAGGLRHILRQDPDTILIGEIRDLETAEIAVRASLTGHLVLATLHTNDAVGCVTRLTDMGVEPYLLAACLRAALAQRLVRCLCGVCRRTAVLTDEQKAFFALQPPAWPEQVWEAAGCPACREGYLGRTGLFELMIVDADLAEAVRFGHSDSRALRDLALRKGMTRLFNDGLDKLAHGVTSVAELQRAIGRMSG